MAIARDASSFNSGTTWTTHTLSHTCSGTNRGLHVTLYLSSSSDLVTNVAYWWVAMSRLWSQNNGSSESKYSYYLKNPSSGANNIVVTTSSSATVIMQNISYTGTDQVTNPTVVTMSGFVSWITTLSTSVTTTVDNSWLSWAFRSGANQTAIAGTTLVTGVNATLQVGDSNWPKTPTGSYSLWVTFSSSFGAQIVIAIAPSVASTSSPAFFLNLL